MAKWGVIINPAAGGGLSDDKRQMIMKKFNRIDDSALIKFTEQPGHATQLAEEMINKGITLIAVAGGDGTFNEAAKAALGHDVTLGVVPTGTGNDFMQISGFSDVFEQFEWDTFLNADVKAIDVGDCNGNPFFNGMGIGFDAEMTAAVTEDRLRTGRISRAKYNYYIVKTLLGYKERELTFTRDGSSTTEKCFMTTCSIGRRFAGNFFLTPKAIADDGLLDVLHINPLKLMKRMTILTQVPKGSHITDPLIQYFRASTLKLTFSQKVAAHLDGELIFSDSFDIRIIPGALKLIYNPDGNHYFSQNSGKA